MGERPAATIAGGNPQDDELRKILIERAQAVGNPRAQGGVIEFARMPSGLPRELRAMIIVDGPERTYDGQVVTILDAISAPCTIPSHRDGNMIPNEPENEKPSGGTRQATARPSRRG